MPPDVAPPGHRYGISPEQYRTDVPPSGPSSTLPRPLIGNVLAVALFAALAIAALGFLAFVTSIDVAPMPERPSNEAVLERQVGALSTHVADLENRNRETLEALAGFPPEPTATPTFHVPADCCGYAVAPPESMPVPSPTDAIRSGRGGTAR